MEDFDYEDNGQYNGFILAWDTDGLETVFNVDEAISKRTESALKEERTTGANPNDIINMCLLRARYNSHRNYKVYAISLPASTTTAEVAKWFEDNFNGITNLIQQKGLKLWD